MKTGTTSGSGLFIFLIIILIIIMLATIVMVNAYGKGDQKKFLIDGSETPQSIPSWVWILIIGIVGWLAYYLITYLSMKQ